MYSFSLIFFQFLFYLSVGTIFFLPLVNSQLTGSAHSKLIAAISAILSLIASLGLGMGRLDINVLSISTLAHSLALGLIWARHTEKRTLEIYSYYLASIVFALFFINSLTSMSGHKLFIVCSTLILGLINYIMILGHYYLVVPKLTVKPLLIGIKLYWFLLLVKLIFIYPFHEMRKFWIDFFELLFANGEYSGASVDISELSLIFFQQLSCYIANPIMSYFSYRLCLMRSTQSATGIFYVMVFFVLVSEMLSLYFLMTRGLRF